MRLSHGIVAGALIASGCNAAPKAQPECEDSACGTEIAAEPIQLTAADGVKVYGSVYRAAKPRALILLFHQAGSSKAEYATIAPRLVQAGYSALAIDQRAGGGMYGKNETAKAFGREVRYREARPDLQAALDCAAAEAADHPVGQQLFLVADLPARGGRSAGRRRAAGFLARRIF